MILIRAILVIIIFITPLRANTIYNLIKIPNEQKSAYPWTTRFNKDYPKNIEEIYINLKKKYIKS